MYERIQELCKQKGMKITALCIAVTGSPGNLATWKKGYMRSDYILKVSQILGCSIEYLLIGEEPATSTLAADVQQLISNYNALDDAQKKAVCDYVASLAELAAYKEAEAAAKEAAS